MSFANKDLSLASETSLFLQASHEILVRWDQLTYEIMGFQPGIKKHCKKILERKPNNLDNSMGDKLLLNFGAKFQDPNKLLGAGRKHHSANRGTSAYTWEKSWLLCTFRAWDACTQCTGAGSNATLFSTFVFTFLLTMLFVVDFFEICAKTAKRARNRKIYIPPFNSFA